VREIIIDGFACGGGASEGIEQATGEPVDIAINHDPEAIRMHWLNHPRTVHGTEDVWKVNLLKYTKKRDVGLLWVSPDCTHHSRAKGGKPRDNNRRSLADVVIEWAKLIHPRLIMLENVVEFEDWGPLDENGLPIKSQKGFEFRRWVNEIRECGYVVEWRRLTACDYGVPTSRERFFLIARRDGQPIVWPEPTHGPGRIPYRSAAECIDFSLPCPSIFLDKKEAWQKYRAKRPLEENTLKRIASGLRKYVIESDNPFLIDNRVCFLTKYHGGRKRNVECRGQSLGAPLLTQDTQNRFGLVSAWLMKYYGTNIGSDMRLPLPTITGQGQHLAQCYAFLTKYYGCGCRTDDHGADAHDHQPGPAWISYNQRG
jgi:DNA (cytosine-5)-methyltransferase 1